MFSQACVIPSARGGGACMAKGGVHGKEGCVWQRRACMAGGMHGGGRHVRQGGVWHRGIMRGRRDGYCSGRYASYWNAFLLVMG